MIHPSLPQSRKGKCIYDLSEEGKAPTSGYSLSISVTGTAQRMNYYTNGINCTGITAKTDFIEKQASGKRIAAVSVDVYPESATVFNDDTRVVHLDTSKGER